MQKIDPGAENFLNASRWLAAFMVVVFHVKKAMFADFRVVPHTLTAKAFYFIGGFGHEAVMIFFVLSGFLVGGLSLDKVRAGRFDPIDYFAHRFARIYIVFLPALLVGAALDHLWPIWLASGPIQPADHTSYLFYSLKQLPQSLSLKSAIANVAMLQGSLRFEPFGSNGPLWSLANEWWYYVAFLAVVLIATSKSSWVKLVSVFVLAACFFVLSWVIIAWGAIWLLGIVAHAWWRSSQWKPRPYIGLLIFLAVLVYVRSLHSSAAGGETQDVTAFVRDIALGIAFSICVVSMLAGNVPVFLPRLNRWCADRSYSLYLCHFPLLLVLTSAGFRFLHMPLLLKPSPMSYSYAVVVLGLLVAFSVAMHWLTEGRTQFARARLLTLLAPITTRERVVEAHAAKETTQ